MKIVTHVIGIGIIATVFYLLGYHTSTRIEYMYSADTTVEYVYKDPKVLYDTVVISQHDTVYIDSSTPIGEIPLRTHAETYQRVARAGDNILTLPFVIETDYRGILYAQRILPENDTVKIRVGKPFPVKFFLESGIAYNTQKRLLGEMRCGVQVWKLYLYGGSQVDSDLETIGKVGVGVRL